MRAAAVAAAALLAAGPAGAQVGGGPCGDLLAWLGQGMLALPVEGVAAAEADGWCEVRDAVLHDGDSLGVRVLAGRLRWRGEGIDRLVAGTGLPTRVEVEVEGFRTLADTGIPEIDWVYEVQSRRNGVDGRVALSWDAATRGLRLDALSVDFPGRSGVEAAAEVTGIDLSSAAAAEGTAMGAALSRLQVRATTDGAFEAFVLPAFAGSLVGGTDDPEGAFEGLRARALAVVESLPPATFPDPSRAEAAEALRALPAPTGTLTVEVAAQAAPIPAARVATLLLDPAGAPADPWSVLQGARVAIGWEPLAPEE